jgi:hypothetical protein
MKYPHRVSEHQHETDQCCDAPMVCYETQWLGAWWKHLDKCEACGNVKRHLVPTALVGDKTQVQQPVLHGNYQYLEN